MESFKTEEYKENGIDAEKVDLTYSKYEKLFGFSVEDLKEKSVLDIGAGSGDFIRKLREQHGNTKSFAVDLNQSKIPQDRPEWYLISDGLKLPFADETFDVVIAKHYIMLFYLNDN
jgi:ubiquinone/menaquinone biosynthesis C-methylase UbiE